MLFLAAVLAFHLPPVDRAAPNRQPQLAAAGDVAAVVYGSGENIWIARSGDRGQTFAAPVKVATLPKLMLGRHRGPRVTIAGKAIVVSAIASEPGDLVVWRSEDGGRSWSAPVTVNDTAKAAREGLHAMASDGGGHVALAWLDDRSAPGKKLYGAFSNDGGKTWGRNVVLYASPEKTICECCHPSLVSLGGGEFEVMWRNALGGSRDLYAMRVKDGAAAGAAVKQGTGTWKLDACPMDGGGLVVRGGAIASAWRREHDVYLAEAGKDEVKLGAGMDVALTAGEQGLYAVWTSAGGIELYAAGKRSRVAETGAFPAIVNVGDGVLAVWEENGAIKGEKISR
ncbi:MAG: glycosyl hydrolase, repeat-containing protein [Candidatus Solibacter sp.]|nr:glycosyl hydrolase, repeat-containing protein [Candidatus Solibacter sp.]